MVRFACAYVDMKWPNASPAHRRTIADALVPITVAMLRSKPAGMEPKKLRQVLRRAFNTNTRQVAASDERTLFEFISRSSRPTGDLAKPYVLRSLLMTVERKHDGTRAAPDTIRLRRTTLTNALDYAVERALLQQNPLANAKLKKHTNTFRQVDRRSVANPIQARVLLAAVRQVNGRLVAFFALMYFAALWPEEATNLRRHHLSIPPAGWGEIHLDSAAPEIGQEWTDSGTRSEQRGLKHRQDGTGRTVPVTPGLTAILHEHIATYGLESGDRLFCGARNGGRLSSTVYGRAWAKARALAFTPEVVASPLAKKPYDLRHAAVSTWLNGGVEAPRVAEWAGHSLSVPLRVYAKCLDGGEHAARARVQEALTGS